MDQRRHHAARVEFQILGIVLIALVEAGFDVVALPLQSFLGKHKAHLLRRGRPVEMVEFKRHV